MDLKMPHLNIISISVIVFGTLILLETHVCSEQNQERSLGESVPNNNTLTTVMASPTPATNRTNSTSNKVAPKNLFDNLMENQGMLLRTLYVLIGVTVVIVLYFAVKTIRLRRLRSKTKKYGVLASADDNMEMRPLDADDDEEDMTVFEINGRPK